MTLTSYIIIKLPGVDTENTEDVSEKCLWFSTSEDQKVGHKSIQRLFPVNIYIGLNFNLKILFGGGGA